MRQANRRGDIFEGVEKKWHRNELFSLFIILFSLFIVFSCSINTLYTPSPIERLVILDSLSVTQAFDKVVYSPFERVFYCLSRAENTVSIYSGGQLVNRIGRSGFGSDNFRNLSDIAIGNDGFLYALDGFDSSIKRFDRDGRLQNSIHINQIASPSRFAISPFGAIFIYDSHSKEIHLLDTFDPTTSLTFGKFQFDRVEAMFVNGEYLNIYDSTNNHTTIYLTNGFLENDYAEFSFYDTFTNLLSFKDGKLTDLKTDKLLYDGASNTKGNFDKDVFILHNDKQIKVYRAESN